MRLSPPINYCNLCRKFSRFEPFGTATVRDRALCSNCRSLERHRMQWQFIMKETDIFKRGVKLRILHVAPEAILFQKFTNFGQHEYIGIDLDPSKRNLSGRILKQSVTKIKFRTDYFDVVIANHVFEHVLDDDEAIKEVHRVMKPGGVGLLDTPVDYNVKETYEDQSIVDPEDREREFGQYDHVRMYGTDFFDKLRSAGLRVNVIDYSNHIFPLKRWLMSLDKTPLIKATKE